MAIDTANEQHSLINFNQVYQIPITLSMGSIGQSDQQALVWQYAGLTFGGEAEGRHWMKRGRKFIVVSRRY